MSVLLAAVLIWIIVSIPTTFLVGLFLSLANYPKDDSQEFIETVEEPNGTVCHVNTIRIVKVMS